MDIIELRQVTKKFGALTAVNELDLKVPSGTIYGFIGPNGSGKTTTIRMIMNILYPDQGTILLFGKEQKDQRLDHVGYLPEERGLYKKMKVYDVLKFHGELKNGKNIRQEIDYWLKKLDLSAWRDKKVESLSKGMTQKLQFIATVIDKPGIIILDEPFSGLDPVNAEILREALLELQKAGSTVIFSTHDMNMAEKMCDYIFMIHKGRKVLDGTLAKIQDQYGSDTLRIQTELGADALEGIKDIEKISDFGQVQEVRLSAKADSQVILADLMNKTRVLKFEVTRPSLYDIFIRIAAPERKEDNHA
ncbi:MAG: ATP-binding cassette domain-containing protein [Bacteroidales bacterium]|nr:ATP-binding cassette domain-containing protein [Bacteroidales bacterium]